MVWLHPGGYTSGSGASPATDGEALAKKGVVLVTINYRLGIFGFFSHPDLTRESDRRGAANQAFLDQAAALQWVQRNIAAFGGDPKRVTVFGDSAGASSIGNLVASPLTKGTYRAQTPKAAHGRFCPSAQSGNSRMPNKPEFAPPNPWAQNLWPSCARNRQPMSSPAAGAADP
jgi:para-nitrobenzyl esterase